MPSDAPLREHMIPLSVPEISGNERRYLAECLDSNWVSSAGPFVERFERAFAERLGSPGAVAVMNGTAALHLALLVAGVEPDDEVIMPALSFIAPANAIRYVGAWPRWIDVDETYWQLDPALLRSFLERECTSRGGQLFARDSGRRIRAILPVHILGHPVDMDPVLDLARRFDLRVIEDATESLGAKYRGKSVGRLGDVGCFSFNGNKLITTGGGGMIVSDHTDWLDRARYLSTQARDHPHEYIHGEIGYNYRLTNVQAALGCAQIERLDEFIERKRSIAIRYSAAFSAQRGIWLLEEAPWAFSAFWLTTIAVDSSQFGRTSRDLLSVLRAQGIETRSLWQPMNLSKPHFSVTSDCPVAADAYRDGLSLPSSVSLTPAAQDRVIEALRSAVASTATMS